MEQNQPNIISNELDQVSKTWDRYLKRLQDPELKKQIIDAMKRESITTNDSKDEVNDEMIDRFDKHQKEFPIELVVEKLKSNEKVSILYHKKNIKDESKGSERHKTIWAFLPAELQFNKLWVSLHRKDEYLSTWDLWTYLTFKRNDYWQIVIWAEQIEIPQRPLTMEWLACHKKMELSEFLEYIKKEEEKDPNKKASEGRKDDFVDAKYQKDSWVRKSGRQRIFG